MAKAKFTQEQVHEAMAEFFTENGEAHLECSFIAGAGNNGGITVYKKEEQNGKDERPSN